MNKIVLIAGFLLTVGLILINSPSNQAIQHEPVRMIEGAEVATFAAGCFWCTEAVFQETEGVHDVVSGYAGGTEENPTYEQVYTNTTGHREAVQIFYDPAVIAYSELLDLLWRNMDPTDDGGQFVDRGFSYTTAIFYHSEQQQEEAELSRSELASSDRFEDPIVTPVLPFTTFYEAEAYHQDFYKHSRDRYDSYEANSGRESYKAQVWEAIQAN